MKIILACDPAAPHEEFVEQATARSWPTGSEFRVVAAVEGVPRDLFMEVPDLLVHAGTQAAKHAAEIADSVVTQLRAAGMQVSGVQVDGDPHDAILSQAKEFQADLILLGSPRREGIIPALSHRVARAVIRHAHCSVQIMRTGAVRKVLVPTDGSKYSLAAARAVAARTWREGTVFQVMSVVEPLSQAVRYLYPPFGILSDDSSEGSKLREQEMQHVMDAITETEQVLKDAGLAMTDHVLINVDSPGKLILKEAETWGADLIVMGSHGRSGIKRLLIGSVSESVAIHAGCSVELVR